jgi:hypothetical protein
MTDEARPNTEPRNGKRQQELNDPLAGTEFEHLPDVFAMRNEDGSVIQEREPCYLCRADCFLGMGMAGTLYEESSIVVTRERPNEHMEPLNRAAAIARLNWYASLPQDKVVISIEDMAEAATMCAADPEWAKLNKIDKQKAARKLAIEIKARREGVEARDLPPIGHNFVRAPSRTAAPPLLGAKIADMGARHPGETRFATSVPQYGPDRPITRRGAAAPMGGIPPGR